MIRMLFIGSALLLTLLVVGGWWHLSKFNPLTSKDAVVSTKSIHGKKLMLALKQRGVEAKKFVQPNEYNNSVCFLIDMSIESGRNRFFVYDLMKDSIIAAGLVTHGRCNKTWLTGRKYGNEVGCGCTSLGKYKIGASYKGKFGLAYKLHGLESTNNNAYKRFVVLHSHTCVPDQEVDPAPICQSDGCPTVSLPFLQLVAGIIDKSDKPVLLWIYE